MAITPDVTTVTVDGVVIGLSDTIDNLIQAGEFTIENLTPYMICGQSTVGGQKYASLTAAERNYHGSGGSVPTYYPAYNTGSLGDVTVEFAARAVPNLPHDAYGRNILIHGSLGLGVEPQQITDSNMSGSDMRVVTSIDYKKIYYDVEMAALTYNYGPPSGTATYYATGSQGRIKTSDNDVDTSCFVYSIFGESDDDWYCIKDWMFPADDSTQNGWHMCCDQSIHGNFGDTYSSLGTGYLDFSVTKTMFRYLGSQQDGVYGGGSYNWNNSGQPSIENGDIVEVCSYAGAPAYAGNCLAIITGLDNALKQLANAGLKFKWNNTWYKPTSSGGIITGYTDDMTEESEWDDIVDVIGNIVPVGPTPPTPPTPPSGDDIDGQQMGSGTSLGGVSNLWLLTAAQMTAFHNAMNSADWDVMPSIISVMGLGIPAFRILSDIEVITNIVLKKSDGTTWSSGVNGHICTAQKSAFSFPGITVQRKYNDFRDFSPYATHELFVPMCGWFTLPDIAVERSITVTYVSDIENCKIRAIVSAGDCIIGERDGIMGCSVSLSNTGHALYVNSAIVNVANAVGSGLSLLTGGSVKGLEGAAMAGLGGLSQSVGNAMVNDRINRTESIVGNGARTGFSDGEWILVKSTYTESDESSLYAHTIGYPCNKSGKLSSFHGFTVCSNPHVHISTTSREREEIKQLLEQGVILPLGE